MQWRKASPKHAVQSQKDNGQQSRVQTAKTNADKLKKNSKSKQCEKSSHIQCHLQKILFAFSYPKTVNDGIAYFHSM